MTGSKDIPPEGYVIVTGGTIRADWLVWGGIHEDQGKRWAKTKSAGSMISDRGSPMVYCRPVEDKPKVDESRPEPNRDTSEGDRLMDFFFGNR